MKAGITTYDLGDRYFQVQLAALLRAGVTPDVVVHHGGGPWFGTWKRLRGLWRTLGTHRGGALRHLLSKASGAERRADALASIDREVADAKRFLGAARIVTTGDITSRSCLNVLRGSGPLALVCNSGLVRGPVLESRDIFLLNVHVSKLPRFRGMNNVEWALLHGEPLWATVHRIDRGIDTGDILLQRPIDPPVGITTIAAARDHAFLQGHRLVGEAVAALLRGDADPRPQPGPVSPLDQYYVMHPLLRAVVEQRLLEGNIPPRGA